MFGSKEQRLQKKLEKNNQKASQLIEKYEVFKKEIIESPYYAEMSEVYTIETFYKLPKDEGIMTTGYKDICGTKVEVPMLREGVDIETLLYRYSIYMKEYFLPSLEKEKTSTPKEIKELRNPKRFKEWYNANKELILLDITSVISKSR